MPPAAWPRRARAVRLAACLAAGVAGGLALAGCTVGSGSDPQSTASVSPGATATLSLADTQLVDRHPNGSMLAIRGIEVRPNSIALDISLINGHVEEIRLVDNGMFRDRDAYLVDDFGNPYRYDRGGDNPELRTGPGQELSGSVVFLGRVPADATTFALKTNVSDFAAAVDTTERDRDTDIPSFYIDGIPKPVASP